MAMPSVSGTNGPGRGGGITKPKGKSGARPSHEEMYARMGLQGSEYWGLWEIAKTSLLPSTLEYSKWRLVSEDEKFRSGLAIYNDSRLGENQRPILDTPWVMDYFLKTRWNIDRSNRRYGVRHQQSALASTSTTMVGPSTDGVGGTARGDLYSSATGYASNQSPITEGSPSPTGYSPVTGWFQYPPHSHDATGARGIEGNAAKRRHEGIGWMLNPAVRAEVKFQDNGQP